MWVTGHWDWEYRVAVPFAFLGLLARHHYLAVVETDLLTPLVDEVPILYSDYIYEWTMAQSRVPCTIWLVHSIVCTACGMVHSVPGTQQS